MPVQRIPDMKLTGFSLAFKIKNSSYITRLTPYVAPSQIQSYNVLPKTKSKINSSLQVHESYLCHLISLMILLFVLGSQGLSQDSHHRLHFSKLKIHLSALSLCKVIWSLPANCPSAQGKIISNTEVSLNWLGVQVFVFSCPNGQVKSVDSRRGRSRGRQTLKFCLLCGFSSEGQNLLTQIPTQET